ncbi:MAG TPA: hypothetical protein VHH73_10705, partial [Verrucomicrobiae bacterium]|nr:hypothetical protein [Verrucomicrobiae bacterium]
MRWNCKTGALVVCLGLFLFQPTGAAQSNLQPPRESAMDRFLRYVKIDTQSAEDKEKVPSTEKQWNLARLLEKELRGLGADRVRVSEFCIVY